MNNILISYIRTFGKLYSTGNIKRSYARWSHRRPLNVLLPQEDKFQFEENQNVYADLKTNKKLNQFEGNQKVHGGLKINKKENQVTPNKNPDILKTMLTVDGEISYTKLKRNDPSIVSVLTLIKSKREKEKSNLILLEGNRIIKEALECGCKLKYLIFSQKEDLIQFKEFLPSSGANIYKMPYREIQMWSDLTTSPGVIALFSSPTTEIIKSSSTIPLTIVCDNIREPGNLGAILRISAGVGCSTVLLTKGCVDVWDPKVLRGACGAHFRINVTNKCTFDEIHEKIDKNAQIFLADNINLGRNKHNSMLVGGIPVIPYFDININKTNESVLIIGGETEGLSEDAYKLAAQRNGVRVNIPLENNLESLNSGTSLGIIAFEIQKKIKNIDKDSQINHEIDVSLNLRSI